MLEDLARILALIITLFTLAGAIWKWKDKLWIRLKNWYYGTWGLASAKPYVSGANRNLLAKALAEHYEDRGFKILRVNDLTIPS